MTPFEWRVLRDMKLFGSSGRGAATNSAMEALRGSGYCTGPHQTKPYFLLTEKGEQAIADGEPQEDEPERKPRYWWQDND